MYQRPRTAVLLRAAALAALLFGAATIISGARVLFGSGAVRQAAGAYVPWVLWFNTVAGLAYVAAGIGLWLRRAWAKRLSTALAAASVLVFAALGVHIALGGAYEARTVAAMALRCTFWVGLAWFAASATHPVKMAELLREPIKDQRLP